MGQIVAAGKGSSRLTVNGSRVFYTAVAITTLAMFLFVLMSKSATLWISGDNGPRWASFLDELLFLGFVLFAVIAMIISRRLYISPLILLMVVAFSLIGWVTTLLNGVPMDVAILGFLLVIKPLILLLVYQAIPFDNKSAHLFLKWFDYFLTIVVFVAVAYTLFLEIGAGINPLPGVVPGDRRGGLAASRSFFTHPSPFSSILTLIAFYSFTSLLLRSSKRHLFVFLLSCAGVFLSLRMKAIFLLPVGIGLIFLLVNFKGLRISRKMLYWGIPLSVIGITAIISFSFLFQDVLFTRLANPGVRSLLLKHSVTINEETYGFGAGYGMYGSSISTDYQYSPLYYRFGFNKIYGATPKNTAFITDQWWAWYLGEVGIWATLLFLFILFYVMVRLARIAGYWRVDNIPMAVLAYTAVGSLLFGILAGYAGVYLTAPPTGYFIMAMAGLSFSLHRGLMQKTAKEPKEAINRLS